MTSRGPRCPPRSQPTSVSGSSEADPGGLEGQEVGTPHCVPHLWPAWALPSPFCSEPKGPREHRRPALLSQDPPQASWVLGCTGETPGEKDERKHSRLELNHPNTGGPSRGVLSPHRPEGPSFPFPLVSVSGAQWDLGHTCS